MRIWIMIFSAALFAGGTCLGVALQPKLKPQPQPKPTEPPSFRYSDRLSVSRFVRELDLGEDQDLQLDQILGETQRDLEALGRSIRAAHERSRERVMNILTADQKKKLDELLAAERQKRAENEAEKSVRTYAKLLELSPEESKAFRDAVLDARNKKYEYFTLRKHGEHDEYRAFSRKVREEQNKALEKALTPEKYQRYLELSELER